MTNYTNTNITKRNLTLDGDMYTDRVCLAFNMNLQNGQNCVENFGFFVVEGSEHPINTMQGGNNVLGLAPYSGKGPNFVKAMFD